MTFSFNLLHIFVTQSVNPVYLLNRSLSNSDFEKWKTFLSNEGHAMRLQMMSVLFGASTLDDKKSYLKGIQQQLVMMSDLVNQYLFRDRKVWVTHVDAALIKANYLHSLSFFQEQLQFSFINFPEYYDQDVKITDYYRRNTLPQLRHHTYTLKETLYQQEIDLELIDILIKGLCIMLREQHLSPSNAQYIFCLVKEFKRYETLTDQLVISILIKMNFNQPGFYLYVTKSLNDQLLEINGLHEQKEMVLQHKENIVRIDIQSTNGLHPEERHIKMEMIDFFNEKSGYLDELMALRRVAINDKYESEKAFRMLVGLTVPQLALFFRIQMESGVLSKDGKTEVYNFVAHHFYTEKTVFISSQNLLRRSTNVEFSTALKLWDTLSEMMEWLDGNFSIRNYQRSVQ